MWAEESYLNSYLGYDILDTLIGVYLLSNGEFGYDLYGEKSNDDAKYLWGMFIIASFINMIVFMNMLIAIMGDTFGAVMEA